QPTRSWHDARRALIGARLAAAGVDSARVLGAIDARAARTAELRAATCAAGRDPDPSIRAQALRQQLCLDHTWDNVEVLFAGLIETEALHARAAVDELIGILPVERCQGAATPG